MIFNPVERSQRRPDNVYASHQFIRPAVGIDLPHQHRQNLEGLRQRARGQSESAFDVFEVQAVGFALLLDFVDQLLPHLGIFSRVRRADDQIALPSGRHQSGLRPAVTVRLGEALDRHARHQKIFENAVFDHFDSLRRDALVVILVPAAQVHAVQAALRGIVNHAEELRQHLLVDLLGKGLPFLIAALAVALQAMPEHFMKENRRRSARKQRRTIERFGQ